jgi:hypothetical protein
MYQDPSSVGKVTAEHLRRGAFLYIRQSSLKQVVNNTESTVRQYGLKERAIALGWPADRIHVIDTDQGQSGASAADREGFQRLVTEVGMGHDGIVLGLEVSRLVLQSQLLVGRLRVLPVAVVVFCRVCGSRGGADRGLAGDAVRAARSVR